MNKFSDILSDFLAKTQIEHTNISYQQLQGLNFIISLSKNINTQLLNTSAPSAEQQMCAAAATVTSRLWDVTIPTTYASSHCNISLEKGQKNSLNVI